MNSSEDHPEHQERSLTFPLSAHFGVNWQPDKKAAPSSTNGSDGKDGPGGLVKSHAPFHQPSLFMDMEKMPTRNNLKGEQSIIKHNHATGFQRNSKLELDPQLQMSSCAW